jgi:hypothetical protein
VGPQGVRTSLKCGILFHDALPEENDLQPSGINEIVTVEEAGGQLPEHFRNLCRPKPSRSSGFYLKEKPPLRFSSRAKQATEQG